MKRFLIIAISVFAVACSTQEASSLEEKRALLGEKESEVAALQAEIETLKEEISEMDTTSSEVSTSIKVAELKKQKFSHHVQLTGTVTSKENIMISAEAGGRIVSVPAEEGQKVSKGQILVRIENEAVGNQLAEAKTAFELAETTYKKRKNLWDQNIGSEIEYLQAKSNFESTRSRYAQIQTQYNNTMIKAPINGSVDVIQVNEGEFVSVGTPIVRVVDLAKVEIEAELSEQYMTNVHKGDSVKVKIPALGVELTAPVTFVSQVINPDNRSFKVKVNLDNKDGRIKPNVLANLMINDYTNDTAIVVPSKVITKDLKGDFVYVASNEGGELKAIKKYIKKGRSSGPETEILSGLKEGDKIITDGYNQVNNGETVSVH
ncbi:efflux RND transporter periplasmic adaptor subunit [Owenweeksia hongkongensis]|uniref:efflux RND transporter periplasmic adaptor subunit n=1 Tax=Owenweeksia hongkongensis TaxID=253245 RepID=UPI003A935C14